MENFRTLAEMPEDKFQQIFYDVRKAIDEVQQQDFNPDEIQIAIPKYFVDLMNHRKDVMQGSNALVYSDNEVTFFGYKRVWNFDNYIVVYHPDMPLYLESNYKVIKLK